MELYPSAHLSQRRRLMLVDSRAWDRRAVVSAVQALGALPCSLPNEVRARIHLARPEEAVDGLVLPPRLEVVSPLDFAREVRALRPSLPMLLVCSDPGAARTVESKLRSDGPLDDRMHVAFADAEPLRVGLEALLGLAPSPRSS